MLPQESDTDSPTAANTSSTPSEGKGALVTLVGYILNYIVVAEVEFNTFYCCCISDGFNCVVLSQLAFPFSVMVCRFFSDDQFREAFRDILKVKSIPM